MKGFKRYVGFVGLALSSANAWADLPQSSILSRYGMTDDQLPSPAKTEVVEPVEEKSRFQIQPEQPLVTIKTGPQSSGNRIMDRMALQDLERCRRLQNELARRGGQYVSCENTIPGVTLEQ
ncbi:hypothetical protein K5E40_16770 [Pseudomonas baetica]|uniref:hypothetical protein n=1 Tax=Pseudomonas TaxID=286 RepID=UPI001C8B1C46|nr:hypothetical protein [Pseudomonas baetica]MBX9407329.1 hypothetical protein [Pseudomonas baetica]